MIEVEDAKRMGPGNILAAPAGPPQALRCVGPFAVAGYHTPTVVEPWALAVDRDFRPHPHLGLAAISYAFEGHMTHRDSLGCRNELAPGAIHYMMAGRGVVHSERFERLRVLGGRLAYMQFLLALPDGREDEEPGFVHVAADRVPEQVESGATIRVLLGAGADPGISFPGDAFLHDARLAAGDRYAPPDAHRERAVYVVSGAVDGDGVRVAEHQVAHLGPGRPVFTATEPTRLIGFGGEPVGARYMWWNFIHSSLDAIEAAKQAWREARMKLPPGDTESFSPAPPDSGRPLFRLNANRGG